MHDQNLTVIFLHIPKAAGSTLSSIIRRQYSEDVIWSSYPDTMPAEVHHTLQAPQRARYRYGQLQKALKENNARVRVLLGHEGFGWHSLFDSPVTYISLLRDPIERVISHYYYVCNHPQHRHYPLLTSEGMTLGTYVRDALSPEVDNNQTKYLAGLEAPFLSWGEYDRSILETAKLNIKNHFSVIGLTNRFDESLILMNRTLGWGVPYYVRRNVTKNRPRKGDLPPETLAIIRARNQLDLELYQFVQSRFAVQIQEQGPTFTHELRRLQRWNQIYSRLHRLQQAVKRTFNRAGRLTRRLASDGRIGEA